MKTITIKPSIESERYQAFYEAMMGGTEVEGGYVVQYTEYHEAGELVCKFTLREPDHSEGNN